MVLHEGFDAARTPTGPSAPLPEGAFNGTTCESAQPYVVLCIVPCPPPLTVILLRLPLSLRSTKLVDFNGAGLDSNNNNDKEGHTTPSLRPTTKTTC